ncbi:LysR family transcriptional regulator [Hominifimenecus sp. rT4P-3]|uniref:LysR family transcriptional regulator n=1 Tax=Hominifimenecus sp. rT4P-3 TaxID=3242979 RepID=UPI003DA243A0
MELHQIRYFLKVAELQHMTQAANELHVAQPALSKTIKMLEEDLGTPLFDRTGNKIRLNTAGQIFLDYAREMVAASENVRRELDEYNQTEAATIIISQNLNFDIISLATIEFNKRYPSVRFEFTPYLAPTGNLPIQHDIAIFSTALPVEEPDCRTVLNERIHLGVPFNNPLAKRDSVILREVKEENFLFTLPFQSTLNDIMIMQCRLNGFYPKRFITITNTNNVHYILRNGMGAAFVPEISWYYMMRENGFALVPIREPECRRCINIRWKTSGYVSKASVLFREFLLDFIPKEVRKLREEYHLEE